MVSKGVPARVEHTPGPWRASKGHGVNIAVNGAEAIPVAAVILAPVTPDLRERYKAEQAANACLIAAAPDMLAALENLLTGCPDETFQPGHRLRIRELERLNGTIVMAKAAIAKARGQE